MGLSRDELIALAKRIRAAEEDKPAGLIAYEFLAADILSRDREKVLKEVVAMNGRLHEAEQTAQAEVTRLRFVEFQAGILTEELDAAQAEVRRLQTELTLVKLDPVLKTLSDETEPYEAVKAERAALRAEVERLRNARDGARAVSREFTDDYKALLAERDALRAEIEAAPAVYSWTSKDFIVDMWTQRPSDEGDRPTLTARLIRIEKIEGMK